MIFFQFMVLFFHSLFPLPYLLQCSSNEPTVRCCHRMLEKKKKKRGKKEENS